MILLLLLVSAYVAWRYSKTEVDPDFALFNMAAFTGSWYGRDFADCKPPAIHLWFYALAKIVGADIKRVKFLHHFLMGLGGVLVMYLTNSFWNGLAFTVLVNSAWNYAFHGNVGQVPAIGMAAAIATQNPVIGALSLGLACFFEPKLLLSAAALIAFKGWYIPAMIALIPAVIVWFLLPKDWRKWTWEGSFTIPKRMGKQRVEKRLYEWSPWFTSDALLYTLPWIFVAVMSKPDWQYWFPAALYALMIGYSKVLRQNHMLPFAAWIACAGIPPFYVLALVCWDFLTAGLYLGDIWSRHYGSLWRDNIAAREMGEFLRDKPGSLWVDDYHTAIYIHARKPCPWKLTEQAEMNSILTERREEMKKLFDAAPPEFVVVGEKIGAKFSPVGYRVIAKHRDGLYIVYKKAIGG